MKGKIMKKLLWAVVFVGISAAPFLRAQTAKVIELSGEDSRLAQEVKHLQEQLTEKQTQLHSLIYSKYSLSNKDGWWYGYELSDDYKYIVPSPYKAPDKPCTYGGFITGSATTSSINLNSCYCNWPVVYTKTAGSLTGSTLTPTN